MNFTYVLQVFRVSKSMRGRQKKKKKQIDFSLFVCVFVVVVALFAILTRFSLCRHTLLAQPNFQLCATKINKNIPFLAFYFSFFLFLLCSRSVCSELVSIIKLGVFCFVCVGLESNFVFLHCGRLLLGHSFGFVSQYSLSGRNFFSANSLFLFFRALGQWVFWTSIFLFPNRTSAMQKRTRSVVAGLSRNFVFFLIEKRNQNFRLRVFILVQF